MASANVLCNEQQKTIHITTNLYELVGAVADEARPEEDSLVNHVVLQLLRHCRARFGGYCRTGARVAPANRHRYLQQNTAYREKNNDW